MNIALEHIEFHDSVILKRHKDNDSVVRFPKK
ncbi:MAG: hypothetical protein ACJA1C_000968 [Crocinitomicaceae bacterium]|jgi:hypothetical protein